MSTNGNTHLGGDDFDQKLIEYWVKINNINPAAFINDKVFGQTIRLVAEKAKKFLSTGNTFKEVVNNKNCQASVEIFEDLIRLG